MYKSVDAHIAFKGGAALLRAIHRLSVAETKALDAAMKVSAAALTRQLISEIRAGGVSGSQFRPLSVVATRRGGRFVNRSPFTRLSSTSRAGTAGSSGWSRGTLPVRYSVSGGQGNLDIRFGFVDTRQAPLSRSWKRLLLAHQAGFSKTVTQKQRRWAMSVGLELSGFQKVAHLATGALSWERSRTKKGRPKKPHPKAKYFFWRKSVSVHTTPARPIIVPFWRANKAQAWARIREDFRKKLRGERI